MVSVKTYAMYSLPDIKDDDYLIGVHSDSWIHSKPLKPSSKNVLNTFFADVEKTGLKTIQWFNNTQRIIHATACSDVQAKEIVNFIREIPEGSKLHIYCAKGQSRSVAIANYVRKFINKEEMINEHEHNKHVFNLLERYHNV